MSAGDAAIEPVSPSLLDDLAELAAVGLGLTCPEDRRHALAQGLQEAARETGRANGTECARWLLSPPITQRKLAMLAGCLTNGETYFFREPAVLDALQHHVIPALVGARRTAGRGQRRLRIWSAGCATGEEPYSVAMLLELAIPDLDEWDVTVLATDINPRLLDAARRGVYRNWSFRAMPQALKERFFHRRQDGLFEIAAPIRDRVEFACLNLADDSYPSLSSGTSAMDVILCRNVLMYFHPSPARQVVQRLASALTDGGWLVVGAADPFDPKRAKLDTVRVGDTTLYRKPSAAAQHDDCAAPLDRAPERDALALLSSSRRVDVAPAAGRDPGTAPTPERPPALLARVHANRGDLTEALEWSRRAVAANKTDVEAHFLHASILIEMDRRPEAVGALNRVLFLAPDHVLAHAALGLLALGEGRGGRACKHFDNALTILTGRQPDEAVAGVVGLDAGGLAEIARRWRAQTAGRCRP